MALAATATPTALISSEHRNAAASKLARHGEQAKPFEARLEVVDNTAAWSMKEIEDLDRQRAEELLAAGLSLREVAEELGISKTGAHRLKRQIEQDAAVARRG